MKNSLTMSVSVFIIEDDPEFSSILLKLISTTSHLHPLGHADSLASAKEAIAKINPDVILVDISLPDGSGIELIQHFREIRPLTKILVLSTLGGERQVMRCIEAGACGYMLKSATPTEIVNGIIAVNNYGSYLSATISRIVIDRLIQASEKHPAESGLDGKPESVPAKSNHPAPTTQPLLTLKEMNVLKHLEQGTPSKRIAAAMNLSIFTINQHLRNIYRKLNVHNKMSAVMQARALGIL